MASQRTQPSRRCAGMPTANGADLRGHASGGYIGQFDSFRVIACCAVVLQHSLLWTIAAGQHGRLGLRHAPALQPDGLLLPGRLPVDLLADHPAPLDVGRSGADATCRSACPSWPGPASTGSSPWSRAARGTRPGRSSGTTWCSATTSSTSPSSCCCCTWSSRRCSGRPGQLAPRGPHGGEPPVRAGCWRRTSTTPRPSAQWGTGRSRHRLRVALGPEPDHVPGAVRGGDPRRPALGPGPRLRRALVPPGDRRRVVMGIVATMWYLVAVWTGSTPGHASDLYQPIAFLWFTAAVAALECGAWMWFRRQARAAAGRRARGPSQPNTSPA